MYWHKGCRFNSERQDLSHTNLLLTLLVNSSASRFQGSSSYPFLWMRLASTPLLGHGSKSVTFVETRMVTTVLTPQGFQVEMRVTKTLCKLTLTPKGVYWYAQPNYRTVNLPTGMAGFKGMFRTLFLCEYVCV